MNLYGLQSWFDGDLDGVIELTQWAERKGVDQVGMGDHVALGEDLGNYPFGTFSAPLDWPWYEPLTLLAGIATATRRIRLATGVLISPLRPAVLLAKQLATLDVLSHGRVDIGVGTGWHRAEYEACGVPFEGRLGLMDEQIRACQALWRAAPASFSGKHIRFERLHQLPAPAQPGGVPVWFGVPPTAANFDRIAELGQGWLPLGIDLAQFAEGVTRLRAAFAARGRDPATLGVRHLLMPVFRADGSADIKATLPQAKAWIDAGATMIELFPHMFCRRREEFETFLDGLVSLKG
jgi:probable F420-dependent oxidoreductase